MSSSRGNFLEEFVDDFQSIFSENEDDHDGNKIRTTCWLRHVIMKNIIITTKLSSAFYRVVQGNG